MSAGLWVLAGWLAAAAIFALGCWWGGRRARDLADHCAHQHAVIAGLKAAQRHQGCLAVIGRLSAEVHALNGHINYLERRLHGRGDLDDELRRLTEGGGAL